MPFCGRTWKRNREASSNFTLPISERDIQFTLGPVDSLDHASRLANYGSKMGIDATRKWPAEGFTRLWPDEIVMDAKTKALVDSKWKALAKELGME
jgi:4-hydroxy-3-polyprenylbenzoate decarboxylase